MTQKSVVREQYSNAANPNYEARLARYSAQESAPFFLKVLQQGMRVLDCGCGPGAITVGLAEVVAPGDVVGVDIQQSQVDMARRLAVERRSGNVTFQQGSIYELPFPDASFDAVSAFHLLFHLREPTRALREMRRVLKPGGVIGIRDPDSGGFVFEPWSASAAAVFECNWRGHEFNGGDPAFGRKQRRLLYEADFERVEGASVTVTSGTPEALGQLAEAICLRLTGPAYLEAIAGQGWATRAELDMMLDGFRTWTRRPDAFAVQIFCTALGWAPE
jgi:SAM-dependent methyltransferase